MKSIISLILLILSAALNFKHGWDTFHYKNKEQSLKMLHDLGISTPAIPVMGLLAILTGLLLLLPKTFFAGNVISAMSIVLIMSLALRVGNMKMAVTEIPFLLVPLILIWLKYPFKS